MKVTEESKVNLGCLHIFLAGYAKIKIWQLFTGILKAEFPGNRPYMGSQIHIYQSYSPKFSGKWEYGFDHQI